MTMRDLYPTLFPPEEEKPPNKDPLEEDDLEPVHIYVKKISMTRFEEVPLEAWKGRYTIGHLCQELMVCRSLLDKHGNGDHALCRLPLELIVQILSYITSDWLRVVFLQSMRGDTKETTVLTFLHTTNIKDVCQYLGMETNHPPHRYRVRLFNSDTTVDDVNPYDTSHSVVAQKGSTVFVWSNPRVSHCSKHIMSEECDCAEQERKERIEKYKSTNNL